MAGRVPKHTNWDRLNSVLERANFRAKPDPSGTCPLVDKNGIKVGEVAFTADDKFVSARLYGQYFISGRTARPETVFGDFVDHIEECYAK